MTQRTTISPIPDLVDNHEVDERCERCGGVVAPHAGTDPAEHCVCDATIVDDDGAPEADPAAIADALMGLLTGDDLDGLGLLDHLLRVESFDARALLTRDAGLVVTLDDRTEFQITIVRSC
jgi:hypothetical protein